MIFPNIAFYIILAAVVLIPLSYAFVRIIKLIMQKRAEDDVQTLFFLYWNGTEEDELYAWYKVRYILEKREREDHKLQFVARKIAGVDKQRLYGDMSVSESGKLIDEKSQNPKYYRE